MIDDYSNSDNNADITVSNSYNNKFYFLKDSLTIENDQGTKTMRVSQWLCEDPVAFDKFRRAKSIKVNSEGSCRHLSEKRK